MPLIKISIKKGNSKEFLTTLMKETMDTFHACLKLLEDDRSIRLMEYEEEFFQMKPPYQLIIEIDMFPGRKYETKKKLYKSLVENLEQKLSIKKEEVLILLNEHPKENWGGYGGVPLSEIKLNYKIDI